MANASERSSRNASSPSRKSPRPAELSAVRVARSAVEQLSELTGRQPDTVAGLERTDTGWTVRIEVVELQRIPDSTSVMASYEMDVDDQGMMRSYRRLNRYHRNQAGES